jgi:hypothetical protein
VIGGSSHHLVRALRERSIEVHGALEPGGRLNDLPVEMRPYYDSESLTRSDIGSYEVVVCLEIFPQLSLEETRKACERICALTTNILFSANPYKMSGRDDMIFQPPGIGLTCLPGRISIVM